MLTYKAKELLLARYIPSRSLTDMKTLETAILKFQAGLTSFKKSEYENLWGVISTSKDMKKSVEKLAEMQFKIDENKNPELIFNEMSYQRGIISFKFSDSYKKHISPFPYFLENINPEE